MKFNFYVKGNKKKTMTLKPANKDDLIEIQKLAKLKILEKRILKDFDFTSDVMMCDVDGNTYGMKDLIMYIDKILTKKAESNKSSKKKKSDKKDKSSKKNGKKKNKKKSKKKSEKEKVSSKPITSSKPPKTENGLVRISRR